MDIIIMRLCIEKFLYDHTTPGDDVERFIELLEIIVGNAVDVTNDIIHRETKYQDMNLSYEIY